MLLKVVVVTGGSDGIGAELAKRDGSTLALVLAARGEAKLADVARQCEASGTQVLTQRCDVSVQADCEALIAATLARFGRIDVLVNNAGMSAHAMFESTADLAWTEQLMRINLWGSVWCTHAALPALKASRGQIVAVSSVAGLVGIPARTAYCASKFAMTGFFEALRVELASDGVAVTIAYPGVVATEIRRRGYGPDGRPAGKSGLDESDAMPVDVCARLILDGMDRRDREVVMGLKNKLGRWLKLLMPEHVDAMARAALNRDAHPR